MAKRPSIGRDLLDVPMGDMIREMAFAIADGQIKLDANSVEVAQMMGGLKTITTTLNGEEFVTFEDSRVFFGKEKMSLSVGLDLHNTTTDKAQKAAIKAAAITGSTAVEPSNVVVVTVAEPNGATAVFAGGIEDDPSYVYHHSAKYYDFDSTRSGAKYVEVGTDASPPNTIEYRLKAGATDGSIFVPSRVSMLELGFTPTFYQFTDTIIEVKISIRYTEERNAERSISAGTKNKSLGFRFGLFKGGKAASTVNTSQVNATYSQKYSYSAEGSSLLRTKLTPIPPPAILEERIRDLMEIAREGEEN